MLRLRFVPWPVAALLVALCLGVLASPSVARADGGESISRYDVRMVLRADNRLDVTETIEYDFASSPDRHGIFRDIPSHFKVSTTKDRVYPVDDVDVRMDGGDVPFKRSEQDGNVHLKIGDPGRTVTGTHRYVITYTVRGSVNAFADHEELYWNAIGTGWDVPIAEASASVTGPANPERVTCFAGPGESKLPCGQSTTDGDTARFTQQRLGPGDALTVVVGYPKGTISDTDPIYEDRHDLAAAFNATPRTLGGAGALGALGLLGVLVVGYRVGRDRSYVGQIPGLTPAPGQEEREQRKGLFFRPTVAVEFRPPEKVTPGHAGTLLDERADTLDVTATIVDFAVRKLMHIRELPRKGMFSTQDWELTKLTAPPADLTAYERQLFEALFQGRDVVRLSELKNTFSTDLAAVKKRLYSDVVEHGWYRRSPERTRNLFYTAGFLLLLLALGVTVALAFFTHYALVGLGLVVAALLVWVGARFMPARTGKGTAMLARLLGFRQYLVTAEAEQIRFEEREEIFSRYLPYAIVFGVADKWVKVFSDIGAFQSNGVSGLYWYSGAPGWTLASFDQSIGSFSSTTTGAIASTPSSSGSSGFGGGGFSGGGGGGGGGGSW